MTAAVDFIVLTPQQVADRLAMPVRTVIALCAAIADTLRIASKHLGEVCAEVEAGAAVERGGSVSLDATGGAS